MARKRKAVDFVKEDGKYLFVFRKENNEVTYEVNSTLVTVNGKVHSLDKPFKNITEFETFVQETDLL